MLILKEDGFLTNFFFFDARIEETSETIELNKKKSKKEKKKDKKYHNHEEVLDATLEPEGTLKQKGHKRKQAEDEETVDIGLYDGAAKKKKKKKKEKENGWFYLNNLLHKFLFYLVFFGIRQ